MSLSAAFGQLDLGNGSSLLTILDSLPQGLLLCGANGAIIYANTRCKEFFQLQDVSVLQNTLFLELLDADERQSISDKLQHISDWSSFSCISTFVRPDGSSFRGKLNLSIADPADTPQILVSIGDLTEQESAAIKLNEDIKKYRLLTENMKDVIWSLDKDMRFTYISPSDKLLRGYEAHEVIGTFIFDIIPQEYHLSFQTLIEERRNKILKGEKVESMVLEFEVYCKDGSAMWIEIMSNPVFDEEGVFKGFQGVARDIRQRKEMEFALRETDERYRMVVSNAPIVLFEIDAKGIFRLSEGGGLRKLGLKPAQVVGLSAFDVYRDYPDICNHVRRALGGEILHEKTNVNDIIFDIYYHPVLSKRKKITSLIGIAIEITDKDKAEQLLIESEEKFRTLFESMSEGVALHDLVFNAQGKPVNYVINEVNQSYSIHTGIDISNIKGKLATEVYGTSEPPYFKEFSDVAITGKPFSYETYFPPLERYFRISVVCTGKNRFATVFEDITVAKNRESELKSKNEELERFTYTVSHDLRSPLVTIKGFVGMLQQDIASGNIEEIADDIRRINQAADKMTDLLNDLLELSQIGRIINPPVHVSMKEIVDDTIELLNGIISDTKAEVRIINDMPTVCVDKKRMAEVWQNLIENAIKFKSSQQNPLIEIGSVPDHGENVFFIRDNGQGIDAKYHESIFGLFNKLDTKSAGTGIGLSLVCRIIEIHGGRIWVESEGEGKGATFKFTIPDKH